jgi:hypothetical protein
VCRPNPHVYKDRHKTQSLYLYTQYDLLNELKRLTYFFPYGGLYGTRTRFAGVTIQRNNPYTNKPLIGGPEEDRTPDLYLARVLLSQLSYKPVIIGFPGQHTYDLLPTQVRENSDNVAETWRRDGRIELHAATNRTHRFQGESSPRLVNPPYIGAGGRS